MLRLIISNLVLAYVAFLLGLYWPKEVPEPITLRYPAPTCDQEMERLQAENSRLRVRVSQLNNELFQKEDTVAIVREVIRQLLLEQGPNYP
jgi:hypothetical protein